MSEVMRAHRWGTNARMIAEAVVPLGYIEGDVFDATYGKHGGFWKEWRPADLTTNDLHAPADFHEDFTGFSFDDQAATTVVFDPPYKLNGTPALGDFDNRFGIADRLTRDEKLGMIRAGAVECWRLTARWLLVKVQDQVEGGRMRWQTLMVIDALVERDAQLVDRFDFLFDPRPQPGDRRQLTARSNYSTLLVFKRGR